MNKRIREFNMLTVDVIFTHKPEESWGSFVRFKGLITHISEIGDNIMFYFTTPFRITP